MENICERRAAVGAAENVVARTTSHHPSPCLWAPLPPSPPSATPAIAAILIAVSAAISKSRIYNQDKMAATAKLTHKPCISMRYHHSFSCLANLVTFPQKFSFYLPRRFFFFHKYIRV